MSKITDATGVVHAALEPFTSEERFRIVRSALLLLGDEIAGAPAAPGKPLGSSYGGTGTDDADLPPSATKWISQHSVSLDALQRFFHLEGGQFSVIASPERAKSRQQQSRTAYLMRGLAAYLSTGEAAFLDEDARALCVTLGCYDKNNHNKIFSSFGNLITGSKSQGWKLTIPGIKNITATIKETPQD